MTATPEDVIAGRARWCVVHGDAVDVLPTLADKSVEHLLTDPPYREGLYASSRTNAGAAPRPNDQRTAMAFAERRISTLEDVLPIISQHFARLPRRWLLVFHDSESGHIVRRAVRGADDDSDGAAEFVRTGAWDKTNPMPQIGGDRPGQGFELCSIFHGLPHGKMRWNGGGRSAKWRANTTHGDDRPNHPCPKPLELMEAIVADLTEPDDLVLDPFGGSGTTGAACVRLGRRCIVVERDPTFAADARVRLAGEEQGLPLRAVLPSGRGQLPLLTVGT